MYKIFGKYGKIESIKILKSGNEGYVTFVSDRLACLAYQTETLITTEIAFTWNQPKSIPFLNRILHIIWTFIQLFLSFLFTPADSPIQKLNDDCLFAIFDRCNNESLVNLSETCVRFNDLLKEKYHFPKIDHTFCVELESFNGSVTMLPAKARKQLHLMGKRYDKLDFHFRKPDGMDEQQFDDIVQCYLPRIVKYCTNIKKAKIHIRPFHENFVHLLHPILKKLQTLDTNDGDQLLELCPQLRKIKVFEMPDELLPKSWPLLENLHLSCEIDDKYLRFFDRNPQLKRLKLDYDGMKGNLETIVNHLSSIQKLTINFYDEMPTSLFHLGNLKNLNQLKLLYVQIESLAEINSLLSSELCELAIHFWSTSEDPFCNGNKEFVQQLVSVVRTLPKLQRFELKNLSLDEERVVELVASLPNLKLLDLKECLVFGEKCSMIEKVMKVRKSNQPRVHIKLFVENTQN